MTIAYGERGALLRKRLYFTRIADGIPSRPWQGLDKIPWGGVRWGRRKEGTKERRKARKRKKERKDERTKDREKDRKEEKE